jgi:hypothetical protein
MKYKKGNYKYYLTEDYHSEEGPIPTYSSVRGYSAKSEYGELFPDGRVHIYNLYAYDGPSGPTRDDETNMVPALNHDFGYQLIRLGLLPMSCRPLLDLDLQRGCRKRGMGKFRAWYYFEGVDHFAKYAAKYGTEPKTLEVF